MAAYHDPLHYARRSSHICLAQFPSDTATLRRLSLRLGRREPNADVFDGVQAGRASAFIAADTNVGGLVGPTLSALLVGQRG